MRRLLPLALLVLALPALPAVTPAAARMHAGPNMLTAGHRLRGIFAPPGPPLDLIGAASTGAYSFRKIRSAYAGNAVKLRRASGGTQDIGFTGTDFNTLAAAAFCAATTCFVDTWYDQSGNALDASRAAAQQPAFVLNCVGTQPCLRGTSGSELLASATVPVTLPVTLNWVANRSAGAGICQMQQYDANNTLGTTDPNEWATYSSGGVAAAAPDNAWHTGIGILNNGAGASSLRIDGGSDVTGTVTVSAIPSPMVAFFGADATTCSVGEAIFWNGYALTPPERTALTANQKAYWGF